MIKLWCHTSTWCRDKASRFHRDEKGDVNVGNVMWIAVGVLILVAVVSLVMYFWDVIVPAAEDITGEDSGGVESPF